MVENTPPDWAIDEFCKRANLIRDEVFGRQAAEAVALRSAVRAGAIIIAEHEEAPVDPLLIEAIELVCAESITRTDNQIAAIRNRQAGNDKVELALTALRRGMELAKGQSNA